MERRRILPTFRPDPVVDPDFDGCAKNIARAGGDWRRHFQLGRLSTRAAAVRCASGNWVARRPITAIRRRERRTFLPTEAAKLFHAGANRHRRCAAKELFRAQMLTEMARMSLEDGLVMQIHPGSARNHNRELYERYGRDVGADIPTPTNYVDALQPCSISLAMSPS